MYRVPAASVCHMELQHGLLFCMFNLICNEVKFATSFTLALLRVVERQMSLPSMSSFRSSVELEDPTSSPTSRSA